jgi:asparagine synthetase B (glutamine-hydrolysing)
MYGMSGLVKYGGSRTLARMTALRGHRGPDDSGVWERKFPDGSCVGRGRRLAILDLSEFAVWSIPPDLKRKGRLRPTTKYIFRLAIQNILPREVLQQPKAGFAAPVDYWRAHELKTMADDLLSEQQIRKPGTFRAQTVHPYLTEHRTGPQDWTMQIWQFLRLELWMQSFIDGRAQNFEAELLPRQVASA